MKTKRWMVTCVVALLSNGKGYSCGSVQSDSDALRKL